MKIGIFSPYLDALTGGEKYILTAASCLATTHDVKIFWSLEDEGKIKEKAKEKFDLNLESVRFTKNIFDKSISILERILESRKYDYIIYLSDGSIPFTFCKLILHFQFPVQWVDGKNLKTKFKFLKVVSVICNSQFTKSYIDKTFGIESTVLYPPCDVQIKKQKNKENIILHVGRFGMSLEGANYKKQDVMIKVFKQMVDNGLSSWKFVLMMSVTEADLVKLKNLKQMASGYPIKFFINADIKTVSKYYSVAKIYWHASGFGEDLKKHPEKAEHFGIATVEAMAGGCVPVVIKAGGQQEIVEDQKSGLLWISKEELMKKTTQLIQNSPLLNRMSKDAKKRSQLFSASVFCDNLQKIVYHE